MDQLRKCSYCKIEKTFDNFRIDRLNKSGKACTCNECNNILQRNWYIKNKEKAQKAAKERYHKNKELIREKRQLDRKENPEKHRQYAKKSYAKSNKKAQKESSWRNAGIKNMTLERYEKMFIEQNESCAICKKHQSKFKRNLNVDHNHKTGEVRGLLCDNCNRALGYVFECQTILNNMKNYINDSSRLGL